MKEFRLLVKQGEDFTHFFESSNLEGATVSSQLGKIEKGISIPMGSFETEVVEGGYNLKMSNIETSKLSNRVYRFDILVRRVDSLQKGEYRHDIEYYGSIIVG
ncbi:hypothetical protein [Leptospira alexanderi]|uniref:hypothetical protein n=1 Tax=Leptospira alexanderi TaxID=100053 RepID=UPI0020149838|nr:hypothetical protein [Leptospira alexanderi]